MIKMKLKLGFLLLACSSAFATPMNTHLSSITVDSEFNLESYGGNIVEVALGSDFSVGKDDGPVILDLCKPWPACLVHQQ